MKYDLKKLDIQSYYDKHKDQIDEALVSLRVMREIERFLDYKELNYKDLANELGYTESYISQLMSGVKKVNMAFINRFENRFSAKLDFKVQVKDYRGKFSNMGDKNIKLLFVSRLRTDEKRVYLTTQDKFAMVPVKKAEFESLQ